MSQVIILLIQYFEFQVALFGLPPQDCPVENMSFDYLTETKFIYLFLKSETWILRTRSKQKLSSSPHCRESYKIIVCKQMVFK